MIIPRVDLEVLPGSTKALRITIDPTMEGAAEITRMAGRMIETYGLVMKNYEVAAGGEQIQKQADGLVAEGRKN